MAKGYNDLEQIISYNLYNNKDMREIYSKKNSKKSDYDIINSFSPNSRLTPALSEGTSSVVE